jgi:hypothetical protein
MLPLSVDRHVNRRQMSPPPLLPPPPPPSSSDIRYVFDGGSCSSQRRCRFRSPSSIVHRVVLVLRASSLLQLLTLTLLAVPPGASASGQFQLRLISYRNSRGQLADGSCCRATATVGPEAAAQDAPLRRRLAATSGAACAGDDTASGGQCNVVFRACLREHQARTSAVDSLMCTFGNATTPQPRRANSLTFTGNDNASNIDLSFDFAWTVSCLTNAYRRVQFRGGGGVRKHKQAALVPKPIHVSRVA